MAQKVLSKKLSSFFSFFHLTFFFSFSNIEAVTYLTNVIKSLNRAELAVKLINFLSCRYYEPWTSVLLNVVSHFQFSDQLVKQLFACVENLANQNQVSKSLNVFQELIQILQFHKVSFQQYSTQTLGVIVPKIVQSLPNLQITEKRMISFSISYFSFNSFFFVKRNGKHI